jgi:hypothetical protein
LLPERHQATLEAELERVRRWEARLEAESSALKHREVRSLSFGLCCMLHFRAPYAAILRSR